MTKGELIEAIAHYRDLNLKRAESVVNTIFDSMSNALVDGDRVDVRGFGSFEVREYGAYKGRNPKTGDEVEVKAKKAPSSRRAKSFANALTDPTKRPFALVRPSDRSARSTVPDIVKPSVHRIGTRASIRPPPRSHPIQPAEWRPPHQGSLQACERNGHDLGGHDR